MAGWNRAGKRTPGGRSKQSERTSHRLRSAITRQCTLISDAVIINGNGRNRLLPLRLCTRVNCIAVARYQRRLTRTEPPRERANECEEVLREIVEIITGRVCRDKEYSPVTSLWDALPRYGSRKVGRIYVTTGTWDVLKRRRRSLHFLLLWNGGTLQLSWKTWILYFSAERHRAA